MNKEKIDDMDYYEKYLLNATKEERAVSYTHLDVYKRQVSGHRFL